MISKRSSFLVRGLLWSVLLRVLEIWKIREGRQGSRISI